MTDKKTRDGLGADGDDFYEALMQAHEGLSQQASMRLNARLILLMANEIGDLDTLKSILAAGKKD